MISVEHVTHHYGLRPVLSDINLRVEKGEILAVLGPNGMGKSTLMAIIAGLTAPLVGRVVIDGLQRRSSEQAEREIRRKVAYLSTTPFLPEQMTGREWLLAVADLYDVEANRAFAHVDRLAELFDLRKQLDARIASYSTGQKKKAAIAGVLITDAPVLVLDEPFSGGLDPSALLALKRVLRALAEQKDRTVVMAAPVPELVEELVADRPVRLPAEPAESSGRSGSNGDGEDTSPGNEPANRTATLPVGRVAVLVEGRIVACDTMAALRAASAGAETLEVLYERIVNPSAAPSIASYIREFV